MDDEILEAARLFAGEFSTLDVFHKVRYTPKAPTSSEVYRALLSSLEFHPVRRESAITIWTKQP